jgi:RNA polymerase sigma factor (sigma-70 family)
MTSIPMTAILQHLRRTLSLPNEAALTDGELLEGFLTSRDDAAFSALVRRHGPMVWGVCRRVLAGHHDAEDAFQVTFLVLVRKAASVVPREMVANWLYGVAHQTALNARASAARRSMRERQVAQIPEPAVEEPEHRHGLEAFLDQELRRLPDKYRSAIVLCDLEGKTRKEVAGHLCVPEGTLSGRLTRGRAILAKRLARRGVVVPAGAFAAVLAQNELCAVVPASVISSTNRTASLLTAGQAAVRGVVSAKVAALMGSVVRSLLLTKLKVATAVVMLASIAGLGAAGLLFHQHPGEPAGRNEKPSQGAAPKAKSPGGTTRQAASKRGFTVSKETTFLTGPLDKEGYIDYESALNDRLGKDIAPAKNANALLWSALGPRPDYAPVLPEYFQRLKIPAPPQRGAYFVGLARYAREQLKRKPRVPAHELLSQRNRAVKRPWVEKDYPRLDGWLKANEKPLAVAVLATKRPDFYNPMVSRKSGSEGWYGLIGAIFSGVRECREVAEALTARAMRHAGEGKFEEARQDLLACHRLGRLLARQAEPTIYLIGAAIDRLAGEADLALLDRANPTAVQARTWLRDLERLGPFPSIADWYDLGGRFTFLHTVLHIRRHGDPFLRLLIAIDPRIQPKPFVKGLKPGQALGNPLDWDSILRAGNKWYDRMSAAHRIKDRAEREKALDWIGQQLQAMEKEAGFLTDVRKALRDAREPRSRLNKWLGDALAGFCLQGFRKSPRVADRSEQQRRNLRLALALAAYRGEHGRYPEKLAALAPRYLNQVPDDLFSGKSLIYRPSGTGYLLYSVGINGLDEEGRDSDDTPAGDDISVRMPLLAMKR